MKRKFQFKNIKKFGSTENRVDKEIPPFRKGGRGGILRTNAPNGEDRESFMIHKISSNPSLSKRGNPQKSLKNQKFIWFLLLVTCHLSLVTSVFAEEITSKAALVMEASTGRILYAKNPNLKLPPASTTKLVTAMVVLDRAQLDDPVMISEKATKSPWLKDQFKPGDTVTVKTLLYAALLRSANDAAYALAEHIAGSEEGFVELMNRKIIIIGASSTRFLNTTGLSVQGQQITAYDLAKIMRHALKYPEIREIIGTKETEVSTEDGRTIFLENTNRLLWSDDLAVGGKTGYTRSAKHCFVYACEREGEMVLVALLGAPSRRTMWSETEKLVKKGFAVLESAEQPVVYFTHADYKKGSRPRAYSKNKKGRFAEISLKERTKRAQAKDTKISEKENGQLKGAKITRNLEYGNKG